MTYELRKRDSTLPDEDHLFKWSLDRIKEYWGLSDADLKGYKPPSIKTDVKLGRASYNPRLNRISFNPSLDDQPARVMLEEAAHSVFDYFARKTGIYREEAFDYNVMTEAFAALTIINVLNMKPTQILDPNFAGMDNKKDEYRRMTRVFIERTNDPHTGYWLASATYDYIDKLSPEQRKRLITNPRLLGEFALNLAEHYNKEMYVSARMRQQGFDYRPKDLKDAVEEAFREIAGKDLKHQEK